MKKAKIMLSAIAAIAIVSGALAFKAKNAKFGPLSVYSCNTVDRQCDILVTDNARTVLAGTPGAITYSSVATDPNVACVTTCPNTITVLIEQ